MTDVVQSSPHKHTVSTLLHFHLGYYSTPRLEPQNRGKEEVTAHTSTVNPTNTFKERSPIVVWVTVS